MQRGSQELQGLTVVMPETISGRMPLWAPDAVDLAGGLKAAMSQGMRAAFTMLADRYPA
jgi:hypothetical protein